MHSELGAPIQELFKRVEKKNQKKPPATSSRHREQAVIAYLFNDQLQSQRSKTYEKIALYRDRIISGRYINGFNGAPNIIKRQGPLI